MPHHHNTISARCMSLTAMPCCLSLNTRVDCVKHHCLCLQAMASSASAASFNDEAAGKAGFVCMRAAPQQQADPLGDLLVASADVRQAAEVVMGRLDITQLVGGPQVQETAAQVGCLQSTALYNC